MKLILLVVMIACLTCTHATIETLLKQETGLEETVSRTPAPTFPNSFYYPSIKANTNDGSNFSGSAKVDGPNNIVSASGTAYQV